MPKPWGNPTRTISLAKNASNLFDSRDPDGDGVVNGGGGSTGNPTISSVTDNGDGTLTITGSGFGAKSQAAPVIHDFVDLAYENGVSNTVQSSISEEGAVGTDLYTGSDAFITRNKNKRGAETAHYISSSSTSGGMLFFPKANGGNNPPIADSVQGFYGAFWFRLIAHPQWHWVFRTDQASALNFNTSGTDLFSRTRGETVTLNGSTPGTIVGAEQIATNMYQIEVEIPGPTAPTQVNWLGTNMVGDVSGTTITLPSAKSNDPSEIGFITPRFKFVRIWQPSGEYVRITYSRELSIVQGTSDRTVSRDNIAPNQWNLLEVQLLFGTDPQDTADIVTWINGVEHTRGEDNVGSINLTWDPSQGIPALTSVGPPGDDIPQFNVTQISEIYQDKTRQRVVVADVNQIQEGIDVTPAHQREIQRPLSWSDTEITFEKNPGQLSSLTGNYIYVYGPDGKPNEFGVIV